MSSSSRRLTSQQYGWKDLVGVPVNRDAGGGRPTFQQMGTGPFWAYQFDLTESLYFYYHMPHDWSPGTAMHIHAHWTSDGTNVQPVAWQWEIAFAQGFNQGAGSVFPMEAGFTTVSAQEAAVGSAWQHMTTETAAISGSTGWEVDGLLIVRTQRISNGGTDNTDNIYLLTSDLHYQADRNTTPNRSPSFY